MLKPSDEKDHRITGEFVPETARRLRKIAESDFCKSPVGAFACRRNFGSGAAHPPLAGAEFTYYFLQARRASA